MARWTTSYSISNASDGTFRGWIGRIREALTACGMVQSSDTGQINPATVLVPTTINTWAGSEIWCFNDALQATSPVYFKLDYGTGATAGYPALQISVGQGSSGACALTGKIVNQSVFCGDSSTTGYYPWYASGDGGRFVLAMGIGSVSTRGLISLERGRDYTGAPVGDDIRLLVAYRTSPYWWATYIRPSDAYSCGPIFPLASAPDTGTGSAGNLTALYPIRFAGPQELTASFQVGAYFNANLTARIPVSAATWDGATHSYMPIGDSVVSYSPTRGGSTVVAILYE